MGEDGGRERESKKAKPPGSLFPNFSYVGNLEHKGSGPTSSSLPTVPLMALAGKREKIGKSLCCGCCKRQRREEREIE